ncbi:MAG: hypothetical protein NTW78_04085 [Campylobacterales bacterium]|nr:hypothetical protein [Campylobacterales bacterium]
MRTKKTKKKKQRVFKDIQCRYRNELGAAILYRAAIKELEEEKRIKKQTAVQILEDAGYAIDQIYDKAVRVVIAFDADGEIYAESELINNSIQSARRFLIRHGKPSEAHKEFLKSYNKHKGISYEQTNPMR